MFSNYVSNRHFDGSLPERRERRPVVEAVRPRPLLVRGGEIGLAAGAAGLLGERVAAERQELERRRRAGLMPRKGTGTTRMRSPDRDLQNVP